MINQSDEGGTLTKNIVVNSLAKIVLMQYPVKTSFKNGVRLIKELLLIRGLAALYNL